MANIQIGTNLRNCKITLDGTISYGYASDLGDIFAFTNNSVDYIRSGYDSTAMPPETWVLGHGIFSSIDYQHQYNDVTINQTFDIPNDKDYIVSDLNSDVFTTATYEPLTSNIQIPITKNGKTTLATKGTKNVEDIDINVDIAPTIQSLSITPSETSQTFNASNVDGYKPVNVSAIQTETPTVNLSLASGNQTVNASSGKYIKSLTITKPSTLVASNIKSGVNIAGINGSYEFKTQDKTFTPTQAGGSVTADSGYDGLGVVTVNPVPLGNKTDVPLNFYNQTVGTIEDSQNIYSDENKFMTWASVSRPSTLIAENIKKDINIAGITGTLESGGASLNIAYGGTAPSDTSKLWITGSEPENLLLIGGTPEPILEDKISTLPALSVTLPTLPTAASGIGTAAVGTKIYLFGGYSSMTGNLDTIQVFDTTNNTISTLSTKLPNAADGMGIAAVGTKIYLFGGHYFNSSNSSVYLNTIQVFDTTNNTLSTLPTTLPTPTTDMGAAAVGTKIYLFGGENWSGSNHYRFNTIRVFDTTNNTISTLSTTLPEKTSSMGIAAVGTRIYLFGGYYFNSSNSTATLNTIQVFDTTDNTILTPLATLSNTTTESVIHTATVGTNIYLFGVDKGSYDTIQLFDTVNSTISTFATTSLTAASGIGTAAVGTKIYLFGGDSNTASLNTIQVFDTTNNTISTLPTTLPTATYDMGTAAVGTKIYLFGGYEENYLNTINVFDTTNNTISTLPTTLPTATYRIRAAAVGTKIYLFGGNSNTGRLNTIQVFDTTNNTISTLSTKLPNTADGMGTAAVGTKIYLFGGYGEDYLDTIQVFDTTNNTISTLSTKLPAVADGMGTAAVGTKIYLFGGTSWSGNRQQKLNTINVFDTTNNTISTLSTKLPTAADAIGTSAVGTRIYLFGGYYFNSSYSRVYLNTVNIFFSRIYLSSNSILITESQQENIFNLLSSPTQVEISVKNVYRGDSSNIAQLNNAYLYNGTNWVNVNTGEIHQGGHVLTVAQDGYGGTLGITKFDGTTQNIKTSDTPTTVSGVVSIDSVSYAASQDKHLSPNISIPFTLTDDITITVISWCFIEGTPITLANHTYKNVEDITYDDNLLVWDFDKGEFSQAKPLWIMKQKKAVKYNHLVFSDNSELNTVEQHRIFNIEKGMFTYPMTEDTPIGTHTLNDKGEIVELVSKEVVEKEVNYYNIITNYHINLFAGHILTSCRLSNIYPIKDFKYVKDNREIIPFEKFNVPKEYYDGLRLGEQPTDINRDNADYHGDNSVEDYVKRLIRNKK